ncbi:TIGR04282 family arsenosugar biosynthesis glycosyltransferase [uncultured Muriicola sp.]|uniref:TIGR04282 family arsenosugar biosynthesis glycosyltransferase n=1 Tax=uncultured Muriicola sp. TaxID=1583102 RepID=UPI002629FAEF|nr:TIGR04282 family arsenosugar biosynthesis glycosyltransferase [uncultured Muriicola sp.]
MKQDHENLLLIFTRNPELGKCKTRLAASVGDKTALAIYIFLLEHTVSVTRSLNLAKVVYYSKVIQEDDLWDPGVYQKKIQEGEDLGERMANAFKAGFKAGYKKIAIIGSDLYDLSPEDLEVAFKMLQANDFVLGPASDGGYYFLGMTHFIADIFKNKDWGTSRVLEDTLADLKNKNVYLLETKNDVDVLEDIANVPVFQPFLKNIL